MEGGDRGSLEVVGQCMWCCTSHTSVSLLFSCDGGRSGRVRRTVQRGVSIVAGTGVWTVVL